MHYTIQQWLLFFYIYCFLGWCFESTYVSLRKKRFVNRGFLHSPLLPIYGSGAVVMLVVTLKIRDHVIFMFLAGMVGATILELVVGLAMEAVFKVKYWDYSNQKLNYRGVICLSSSLCWGLFTVLLNKVIHRPVEAFVLGLPGAAVITVVSVVSVIFVCDAAVSVKVALGIRDMLDVATRLRRELIEAKEQLGERISVMKENIRTDNVKTRENLAEKADLAGERLGVLLDSIGDKLAEMGSAVGSKMDILVDATNEKLNALVKLTGDKDKDELGAMSGFSEKLKVLRKERKSNEDKMTYLKVRMLKRNPSATSGKFEEAFKILSTEEIKKYELRKKIKKEEKKKNRK